MTAQTTQNCDETDPNQFFSLINAQVQSYIPPLDRNGNTILSENDVFIQKSRHYFAELKEFPEVTISMERFASVTENNPTALENFESKITILGPDCSQVNTFEMVSMSKDELRRNIMNASPTRVMPRVDQSTLNSSGLNLE